MTLYTSFGGRWLGGIPGSTAGRVEVGGVPLQEWGAFDIIGGMSTVYCSYCQVSCDIGPHCPSTYVSQNLI